MDVKDEKIQKLEKENKILYMKVVGVSSENISLKKDKTSLQKIIKNQAKRISNFIKIYGGIYWLKKSKV